MKTDLKATVEFKVNIQLSEREAKALKEIAAFGHEAFLKVFYEHLGKSTMQPYEAEIKSLFEVIRTTLSYQLSNIGKARQALSELNKVEPIP
jgi:hypothetical protein